MRARVSPSLLTRGFSLFEALLCIAILGILLYLALPKMSSFAQKECLYALRAKLLKAQDEFFALYSHALLTQEPLQSPYKILASLEEKISPQCYFQVKNAQIIAFVYGKKLLFTLYPQDFSYKPKIYCSLSNEMCREFWGKEAKK